MFNRVKNVLNAALGRHVPCGNCTCNEDSIDLKGMPPEVADMLKELALPENHGDLIAEIEEQSDIAPKSTPSGCVHLDYIPVCHCGGNDVKPDWCAASKCPVRAYAVAVAELQKKAAMVAYG